MRLGVHLHQARRIHAGIDLGRRQAGVAQQRLDRAQVAAIRQQMRREGVAQCVGRRCFRQAELVAQPFHQPLHQPRIERSALCAAKDRLVGAEDAARMGLEGERKRDRAFRRGEAPRGLEQRRVAAADIVAATIRDGSSHDLKSLLDQVLDGTLAPDAAARSYLSDNLKT